MRNYCVISNKQEDTLFIEWCKDEGVGIVWTMMNKGHIVNFSEC